ncbi:hypothetical protein PFISCL1PPCAC_28063, partial [Pristionchus fissidentatus]
VTCKGKWRYNANNDEIPANAIGFVCGKEATCNRCTTAARAAFNPPAIFNLTAAPEPPICSYFCDKDKYVAHKGLKQEKVVCDMVTEVLTINMKGGDLVDPANQFSCEACTCSPDSMVDANGICPLLGLCVKPTPDGKCKSTCPPGTEIYYKNRDGMAAMSATIECQASGDWIQDGSDSIVGVTCSFTDPSQGSSTTPPEVFRPCPPLTQSVCQTPADCQYNVVYVKTADSYKATCKSGAITSPQIADPAIQADLNCGTNGMWEGDAMQVTCVIKEDVLVGDCLNTVSDAATRANLGGECAYGTCAIKCKDGKMLAYMNLGGDMDMQPSLECKEGEILAPFGESLQVDTMMCI